MDSIAQVMSDTAPAAAEAAAQAVAPVVPAARTAAELIAPFPSELVGDLVAAVLPYLGAAVLATAVLGVLLRALREGWRVAWGTGFPAVRGAWRRLRAAVRAARAG